MKSNFDTLMSGNVKLKPLDFPSINKGSQSNLKKYDNLLAFNP
jgi:hypothetical protein